jgi:hypothetical protein
MIPSDVRETIKAKFPDCELSLTENDDSWCELHLQYQGESISMTVANTEEGWKSATAHAMSWLENVNPGDAA